MPSSLPQPQVAASAWIAPGARVTGDVVIGERVSVWYNATVRGDLAPIRIGDDSNIQDNAVLHVDVNAPLTIGRAVTVGHAAILHGCTVHDGALIGMGATVLNGAVVGEEAIVGAGAVVTEGFVVPPGTLALGVPARVVRELAPAERQAGRLGAEHYAALAAMHRAAGERPKPS